MSERGISTSLHPDEAGRVSIPYILGVTRILHGFDQVAAIEAPRAEERILLRADSGIEVALPCQVEFLKTRKIPLFHANVRLHLGRASFLLNNPHLHRIHHSRLPQHRDRNFANYYPIWDVIFGTYYEPSRDEYPATGVEGEPEIRSFTDAQLVTLRGWWQLLRGRRQGSAEATIQ